MKQIERRVALRALAYGIGALTIGRAVAACSAPDISSTNEEKKGGGSGDKGGVNGGGGGTSPAPTDQDEHVPGKSAPVDTGTTDAPKVPVQSWEARVKQLESEQKRVWSRTAPFERGDAGPLAGKENSHVPKAAIVFEAGVQRVEVVVEHVMGTSALDGGSPPPDAALKDAMVADAADASAPNSGDAAPPPPPLVHYITTIYVRGEVDGKDMVVGLWEFSSTDPAPPTIRFTLPKGVKAVTAYEWCTLHGLWRAPEITVP